jgi:hypothetical protein
VKRSKIPVALIDYLIEHCRQACDADWDVVSRLMNVMESQFTKKTNDDDWNLIYEKAFYS